MDPVNFSFSNVFLPYQAIRILMGLPEATPILANLLKQRKTHNFQSPHEWPYFLSIVKGFAELEACSIPLPQELELDMSCEIDKYFEIVKIFATSERGCVELKQLLLHNQWFPEKQLIELAHVVIDKQPQLFEKIYKSFNFNAEVILELLYYKSIKNGILDIDFTQFGGEIWTIFSGLSYFIQTNKITPLLEKLIQPFPSLHDAMTKVSEEDKRSFLAILALQYLTSTDKIKYTDRFNDFVTKFLMIEESNKRIDLIKIYRCREDITTNENQEKFLQSLDVNFPIPLFEELNLSSAHENFYFKVVQLFLSTEQGRNQLQYLNLSKNFNYQNRVNLAKELIDKDPEGAKKIITLFAFNLDTQGNYSKIVAHYFAEQKVNILPICHLLFHEQCLEVEVSSFLYDLFFTGVIQYPLQPHIEEQLLNCIQLSPNLKALYSFLKNNEMSPEQKSTYISFPSLLLAMEEVVKENNLNKRYFLTMVALCYHSLSDTFNQFAERYNLIPTLINLDHQKKLKILEEFYNYIQADLIGQLKALMAELQNS